MKPSQLPWKWLLFGLLTALLLAVALLPWLIGDTSRFGDRIAAKLSAWTGGDAKFTGPVRVSFFPDISVRGPLELQEPSRLPRLQSLTTREAKISLDLLDALRGRLTIDALRLLKPRFTLRREASLSARPPQAVINEFMGAVPVRVLHVRKGRLTVPGSGAIKEIYAHLNAGEERGAVSGFGSFVVKDTTVRYSLESGAPSTAGDGKSMPITLALTSKPLRLKLAGTASFASEFALAGDMEAEIDDVRKFLKWVGIDLPKGESLKGFSAAGKFHLSQSTLTFDDGTFVLDGNKAVGLLAVTAIPSAPRIEGTLAFDRLVLDPYLATSPARASASGLSPEEPTSPFEDALLRYFDADLRISAGAIAAGGLKLGGGGFTITAKQGAVASEVGELEFCGGSADGRLNLDLGQATNQLNLVANLAEISLDSCLRSLGLAVPLKGTGGLKGELSTEGADLAELTRNLAGTVKVDARDGAVPVNFAQLVAAAAPFDGNGWSRDSANPFNQFDADCRLSAGHIWCQTLTIQTPQGIVTGTGEVDLMKQTQDWSLSMKSHIGSATASQLTEADSPKVSIRGSLSQPMIRRADRPTLGEGSLPTSPIVPQVVPY